MVSNAFWKIAKHERYFSSGLLAHLRFGDVDYGPMDEYTQLKMIVDGKAHN